MDLVLWLYFDQENEFHQQCLALGQFINNTDDSIAVTCGILDCIQIQTAHLRIPNYYEDWIENYLDTDFYSLFRMNRNTFHRLLEQIQREQCERQYCGGHEPIPIAKCLLMTLWWLGRGERLICVSDKFNVSISTVYRSTNSVINLIKRLIKKYIIWPDIVEAVSVEADFKGKSGFPGIIGAIDVCNIQFKCPENQQTSYIDKNMKHSMKLQGIVTTNKIFTNIMCGFPGSAHDSRVFQNSQIFQDVERNLHGQYFYENYHIIGDKAYPLKTWILTPYKNNGNLGDRLIHYNKCHSKSRIVVEHTFGILKSRWQILKYINVNSVEKSVDIIAACCVLHNFCYIHTDFWENYELLQVDNHIEPHQDVDNDGIVKRFEIANMLWRNR